MHMNTYDAIDHIRSQSLSRPDAVQFLIQRLGFTTSYAEEIVSVVVGDKSSQDRKPPAEKAAR